MTDSLASAAGRISSIASCFDALASGYDNLWTCGCVGQLQRQQVWRELLKAFVPGNRILELGCGTGVDAARLACAGVRVHATDVSPQMLRVTSERVEREGLSDKITCELVGVEQLSEIRDAGPFDGAFSNFGAFNCVGDLRSAASGLARLVRPGGKLVLCLMGKFCLWETVWCLLHGRFSKAFRRLQAGAGGLEVSLGSGLSLRVFYPSVPELVAAFRRDFDFVSYRSIGVLVPPSYLEKWAGAQRRMFNRLSAVDELLGRWPVYRLTGDHRLVSLVRRGGSL